MSLPFIVFDHQSVWVHKTLLPRGPFRFAISGGCLLGSLRHRATPACSRLASGTLLDVNMSAPDSPA